MDDYESLVQLERELRSGQSKDQFREARRILREWLFERARGSVEGSIPDAIELLTHRGLKSSEAACVVLRCLAVDGLIPSGSGGAATRHICLLVEEALPSFCGVLGIDPKAQTFEKYKKVEGIHEWVCDQLSSMRASYVGIESIVSSRSAILSGLNHRVVRDYGEVFRIADIRSVVETVLGRLRRVLEESPTLLTDVDEARRAIDEGRAIGLENGSFLYYDFLLPFLLSANASLESFVVSSRSKFNTKIVKATSGSEIQKRYPLHEAGREFEVRIPLRNTGPGMALSLRASVTSQDESVIVSGRDALLGNVVPGEFSVNLDAMVVAPCTSFKMFVLLEWSEIGSPRVESELFECVVLAQRADINWADLEYQNPYSTEPAEGEHFVGREELLRRLSAKMLRSPMEPYYITGQKRVGKTSLALAAAEDAVSRYQNGDLETKYILWGAIASEDPRVALKRLGESIERFICSRFPDGVTYERGDYNGSLAHLIVLAEIAFSVCSGTKFAITIDEFDEIHQELYMQGNLAETFFANIRALSATKNVTINLVGGENMPFIMERQGQKLNKFTRSNLSYFSRDAEWEDYKKLVRQPVDGVISWHDDAISELFNVTNGNPYFTNLLCGTVLRTAVEGRDADVTAREVSDAIGIAVSSLDANSFVHLWQDGIFKPAADREPEVLRRSRVLVAIARCLRAREPLTLPKIAEHKGHASLSDNEIGPVLNDFVRRQVLSELGGTYSFRLPLFRLWLEDVGVAALVSDALSEELSSAIEAEEEAARVRSDEIVTLSKRWPTYRGQHISAEEIRAWIEQVETHREQRILFRILQATRVFSEVDIRHRLRSVHTWLRPSLPEFVIRKKGEQRRDIVLSYADGEGKSGQYYASTYAEENRLPVDSILSPSSFGESLRNYEKRYGNVAAVLFIDDIAATGNSLAENVERFIRSNSAALQKSKPIVVVVALVATPEAVKRIERAASDIADVEVQFRAGEVLGPEAFAFEQNGLWESNNDRERAQALCRDLGVRVSRRAPLGYGGLGLLLVFPNTTPNNSLPILHTQSRLSGESGWSPLFPRVSN